MTAIIADHIISPLADGTAANLDAVLAGRSAIRRYADHFPLVEPFCASLFSPAEIKLQAGFSRFESLCINAVHSSAGGLDAGLLSAKDTVFILSTTKGNIEFLAQTEDIALCDSAKRIARFFGNSNTPIVVSNACISGVCAIITAKRLLDEGIYTNAVIVGCDVLSPFIISGFQSFKALSDEPCKPYDATRKGLNLGEAAACLVLSSDSRWASRSLGTVMAGSIHNDANHISGPSRTGEGSYLCLKDVITDPDTLAFVNVHGTATLYNDEMESIALNRAGLQNVPVNALKGYFGHTLGAAGLLETILSLHALHRGIILGPRGFDQAGTTMPVSVSSATRRTDKKEFVKLLSGFGGSNAAIRVSIEPTATSEQIPMPDACRISGEVHITSTAVTVNGQPVATKAQGGALLSELYRTYSGDYPKFFKMDTLARLGFVASELLLSGIGEERFVPRTDRAIVMANRSSCLQNDRAYQKTIMPDNYYPSPALFVYTLPNIVTGEIAIRNKFFGESSFYVLDNEEQMKPLVSSAFMQRGVQSVLAGWVECADENTFEAHICLIEKND